MTPTPQRARRPHTTPIMVLIGVVCALAAFGPATARAALGPELVRFGEFGSGAGELSTGANGGIATDPDTGHVFVTDRGNNRISEFTAWGEFVKAWGWGVRDGNPEPQVCTEETGCQQGVSGAGAGQLNSPIGIAVDPGGNVFVFESIDSLALDNQRIQKFSPEGDFLLMVGGGVNTSTGEDICTKADVEGGDTCGAGVEGSGPGEFSRVESANSRRDVLDIGPDGLLYMADHRRIQSFDLNGGFEGELPFSTIHASNALFPEEPQVDVGALAIDLLSGDILIAFVSLNKVINGDSSAWRVSDAGSVLNPAPMLSTFPAEEEPLFTEALALDPAGSIYASVDPKPENQIGGEPTVRQLDSSGGEIDECCLALASPSTGRTALFALATNAVTTSGGVDVYVGHSISNYGGTPHPPENFIEVLGPPPDKWPPPAVPPAIEDQYASAVGEATARLGAAVNPNFWADTTYRVEYGTAPCSEGGCVETALIDLGAGVVKRPVKTKAVALDRLAPDTTYHYRFVAESGGGGPVAGPDRTFTTFGASAPPETDCPNQAFRTGSSAALPACRAYELVSPLDKGGGDILVQGNINLTPARLHQAAPDGGRVTYSASTSFADAESAPYTSQYLASRDDDRWSNYGISPPQDSGVINGALLDSAFRGFLPDLSAGWLVQISDPPLASGAVPGRANLYRRDAGGAYTALSIPTVAPPDEYKLELQGTSADGTHAVFRADARLTGDAAAGGAPQLYESHPGGLRLVSVRPNGMAATAGSTAGSRNASATDNNREANSAGAVSVDGRLVYWSEAEQLYLRVEAVETIAISNEAPSTFWAATSDGGEAIYAEGGALRRFDLATRESTTLVSEGVVGVVGQSADLSTIYLVSTAARAGAAPAGEPNLYLYEAGEPLDYLATLSADDLAPGRPSPVSLSPRLRVSRVSPDGETAIFMSRAALTGADNADLASGEADAELFRYEATAGELTCLSCSPTGARPSGRNLIVNGNESGYWYASRLPGWEFQLHAPRSLSDDGDRVFFESTNRLVLADVNDKQDVYQWEAPGKGRCGEESHDFDEDAGGCVSLISDGRGAAAEFVDASADGRDTFFLTAESLVSWDPGQIDLYDAREGGGLPPPPAPPTPCEGEACQSPAGAPEPESFSSALFRGPGDLTGAGSPARRCNRAARLAKRHAGKAKRARRMRGRTKAPATRRKLSRTARRSAKRARRLSRGAKRCRARARAGTRRSQRGGGLR